MFKAVFAVSISAVFLAACEPVQPLTEYSPVVDMHRVNQTKFNRDLQDCRAIALKVQTEYQERQQKEMGQRLVAGLLIGAVAGAALGSNSGLQGRYIAAGATYGAAAGAATSDYSYDLVHFGPRRIVDRCMSQRGYAILNDIGQG